MRRLEEVYVDAGKYEAFLDAEERIAELEGMVRVMRGEIEKLQMIVESLTGDGDDYE